MRKESNVIFMCLIQSYKSNGSFWKVICYQTVSCQYKYEDVASFPQYPKMIWFVTFVSCIGKPNKAFTVLLFLF